MIPESKLIFKSGNRLNVKSIIYKKKNKNLDIIGTWTNLAP